MEKKNVDMKFWDESNLKQLKKATGLCIAKRSREGEDEFLPLWMHILDTAGVMMYLFDERIPLQTRNLLIDRFQSKEKAKMFFAFLGLVHDIGKETSVFQAKIYQNNHFDFRFPVELLPVTCYRTGIEAHHTKLGLRICLFEGFDSAIGSLVGSHHGKTQESGVSGDEKEMMRESGTDLYGEPTKKIFWQDMWKETFRAIMSLCQINTTDQFPQFDRSELLVLAGVLSQADWISSNTEYFPLISSRQEATVDQYPSRIEKGLEKLDFPVRWVNQSDLPLQDAFFNLFGFHPRGFQSELMNIAEQIDHPGLMIIEAPMGLGKTEAALIAADWFSRKVKAGGVVVGLPTQATANGLLNRFKSWTEKEAGEQAVTFRLAHGASNLNEDYLSLPDHPVITDEDGEEGGIHKTSRAFIHHWMNKSKLALFSDFVIGTVDQILMMSLDHRYVSLRHAGIAGKVVIIDEVHSYDAYMSVYLKRAIEWMGAHHIPVILLSATLAKSQRVELLKSYLKGKKVKEKDLKGIEDQLDFGYPCISWTEGISFFSKALPYGGMSKDIQIILQEYGQIDEQTCIQRAIEENMDDGGCVGVVMNTVRKAQKLYDFLSENLKEYRIVLLHSAFTASDRRYLEEEVMNLVGKKSTPEQRNKLIVIGTQVIEQSLDIDFDYMISELCPIDLLLQRVGRLHRHDGRPRPQGLENPKMSVLVKEECQIDSSSEMIYGSWLLYRSRQVLLSHVSIPNDIPKLVNEVYDFNDKSVLSEQEKEMYEQFVKSLKGSENKSSVHVLDKPKTLPFKQHTLNGLMKTQSIASQTVAENSVRDIDPSLDAILIRKENGKIISPDSTPFSVYWQEGERPCELKRSELETKRIRIPLRENLEAAELEIKDKMKQDKVSEFMPIPFQDELYIVLDEKNEFHLLGQTYQYSSTTGIRKL